MKHIIIAIDGYSACGKSTLARQLAERLQYTNIDSGAMYRAITLYLTTHQVNLQDDQAIVEALKNIMMEWRRNPDTGHQDIWLNGTNVETAIRGIGVAARVSEVAAIPQVREFAVSCQRQMDHGQGIVMDGRDIGTVVFPQAQLKLFMTAQLDIRIQRRFIEVKAQHQDVSLDEIRKNLEKRDYLDTHRAVGPLTQAPDAIVLDNSFLTEEEQLEYALSLVKNRTV